MNQSLVNEILGECLTFFPCFLLFYKFTKTKKVVELPYMPKTFGEKL